MAKQIINVGTSANDGTGDKNRVAFQKCNSNFDELYDGQDPANLISTDPDNAIELGTDGKLWSGGGGIQQYKFLLSQTGGDDPQTATSGSLTQGVTYEIVAFESGDDFIPSGAPNNDVGTKWIANGVAPTWSNGSEIGWNNGAPFIYAQISDYTSYPFWFNFQANGYFTSDKDGGFDDTKTAYFINPQSDDPSEKQGSTRMKLAVGTIYFTSFDGNYADASGILDKTPVEITIKP